MAQRAPGGPLRHRAPGVARAVSSLPIVSPTPGRFSTMTGCPDRPAYSPLLLRAMVSIALPDAKPTMIRTGRLG